MKILNYKVSEDIILPAKRKKADMKRMSPPPYLSVIGATNIMKKAEK